MRRHLLLLPLLVACATTPSVSASVTERLLLEVPEGWIKVVDRQAGNLRMTEYYPATTSDEWTEKITVEAMSGEDLPDPLVFAAGLADEQSEVCNEFADDGIFAGFENAYPTTVHLLQCPQNKRTGQALVTMIKIIQGNDALYTVTRIWRFPPMEKDPQTEALPEIPINHQAVGGWSHVLSKITVCDDALPAHACPAD
jgi:hypothetical protein